MAKSELPGGPPTADLVDAVIHAESRMNPKAVSKKGAIGLMQIMPDTANEVALSLGIHGPLDLTDPELNRRLGTEYLRWQLRDFDDVRLALAAYNAGPSRLRKALREAGTNRWEVVQDYVPQETRNYVNSITSKMG